MGDRLTRNSFFVNVNGSRQKYERVRMAEVGKLIFLNFFLVSIIKIQKKNPTMQCA